MANKKYWMLGVVLLLIVVIAVVLIMLNNMKSAAAAKAYADASEQQGALSEWWSGVNPFANGTGWAAPRGPTQAECNEIKKQGGTCITGNDVFNWIFGG